MKTFIKIFLQDETGASAAEYALILAVVGGGIAVAASDLGVAITGAIAGATKEITDHAPPAPTAP